MFYWATVMATFALGTALGDLTAATFGLGYLLSGILFAALFIIPAIGFKKLKWNGIFTFWFAYVITRPLGASFADYFGKSTLGGIGIGDEITSAVLAVLIIIFVIYLTFSHKDSKE